MEIMDSIDFLTPAYGYCVDNIVPYIGGRHNGHALERTYTEEVAGSSPVPPTKMPPGMGVFWWAGMHIGVQAVVISMYNGGRCACFSYLVVKSWLT